MLAVFVKMTGMQENTKRQAILTAAHTQFRQYGYRKTSMEDIARELGISRASLYSYFENKDEIFRCVSMSLHEQALAEAKSCLDAYLNQEANGLDVGAQVESALLARHRPFQGEFVQSPHGVELHDEYSRLCGDIVSDSHTRFQTMLGTALKGAARRGEVDFKKAGVTAVQAAELLNLATAGLKRGATDAATFEKRVRMMAAVFIAGLRL